MILFSDLPRLRTLVANQKETIRIPNNGTTIQGATCEGITRLALAMHDHSYYFSVRRDIDVCFHRDMNGGGDQGLFIEIQNKDIKASHLIGVIFTPVGIKGDEFHYEADLWMDQRKDYMPTLNKGKHRFVAKRAELNIDWNSDIIQKWQKDTKRLLFTPDALSDWIEHKYEMLVICGSRCWRRPKILRTDVLQGYASKGITLEDLKNRFMCSECGRRGVRIQVF